MGKCKGSTSPSHQENDTREVGNDWEEGCKTDQDSSLMYTQKVETLGPFSSHMIPMKMTEAYLGERLNMMVQALHT